MSSVICIRLSGVVPGQVWKTIHFSRSAFHCPCYPKEGHWREGEGEREGAFVAINQPANTPVLCSQKGQTLPMPSQRWVQASWVWHLQPLLLRPLGCSLCDTDSAFGAIQLQWALSQCPWLSSQRLPLCLQSHPPQEPLFGSLWSIQSRAFQINSWYFSSIAHSSTLRKLCRAWSLISPAMCLQHHIMVLIAIQ